MDSATAEETLRLPAGTTAALVRDVRPRRDTRPGLVLPEAEAGDAITLNPADLKTDTFRASGAGAQHVNKTDSAIRITHLPTGIVVSCQNERSQLQNKAKAMQILAARLAAHYRELQQQKLDALSGEKREVAFGNQIRTYTLAPYQLVKDERTRHETGNVAAVLDGDVQPFVEAYLHWRRRTDSA